MWKNVPSWRRNLFVRVELCVNWATVVYVCYIKFDCSTHIDFYILYDVSLEVKLHTGVWALRWVSARAQNKELLVYQTDLCFSYTKLPLVWRTSFKVPCDGFQMCIWQVASGFTWTWGFSRDWPHFVAIQCSVSAQAADTAHLCSLAQNPSAPGRQSPWFCLSDVAFERGCGILKGCADSQDNPETTGKVWNKEDLHLVDKDQVREDWNKLNICKSVGLMGCIHGCWWSWLVSLWVHSWLSVKGHGDWRRLLRTKRKQMSFLS